MVDNVVVISYNPSKCSVMEERWPNFLFLCGMFIPVGTKRLASRGRRLIFIMLCVRLTMNINKEEVRE
jgi:hypothetical protein